MLFNSLTFLYFFLIVLLVNHLLPLRFRNLWILISGFIFYMSWSPAYILLLLVTALVDYKVAIKMASLPTKAERKPWLVGSLVFSLTSLAFFKYTNMGLETAGSLAAMLGLHWQPPFLHIALPLGISFYTFETISYGVDVYRGELEPKRDFFQYLSFLMFFPKLIAGPIVRASELLHQIPRPRTCTAAQFQSAMNQVLLGFAKKVLLADNFAPFIERVWANPGAHNRWMCLAAVYAYSMQVYLDFSAYSDIAIGCARMMGYELPQNFNRPYAAASISDFWRRWHMTLSRWLRDYLYIPLGGDASRHGGSRLLTYRNLFLTMLLGGLWHGAKWTFVTWGALNGALLLTERAWHDLRATRPKRIEDMSIPERIWRGSIVFSLITFTRIFFRSPDFHTALEMISAIAKPRTFTTEEQFGMFLIPALTIAYIALAPLRKRILELQPRGFAIAGYAMALIMLLALGAGQAEFIYFQF
jgi:alginate O-acetyltransferase complex protein AlgI